LVFEDRVPTVSGVVKPPPRVMGQRIRA